MSDFAAPKRLPETPDFDTDTSNEMLIDMFLTIQTVELLRGEISYGDGDIATKARHVLALGSRQILDGKIPSPAFLKYVAICIRKCIDDGESLDRAFSLRKGPGRPKLDPQRLDNVINAFLDEIYAPFSDPAERDRRALGAAFSTMHGMTYDQMKSRRYDAKSIDNYLNETRKFLSERGYQQIVNLN